MFVVIKEPVTLCTNKFLTVLEKQLSSVAQSYIRFFAFLLDFYIEKKKLQNIAGIIL